MSILKLLNFLFPSTMQSLRMYHYDRGWYAGCEYTAEMSDDYYSERVKGVW